MVKVNVELVGFLASLARGESRLSVEVEGEATVLGVIKALGEKFGWKLEKNLAESFQGEAFKVCLILLNGVEVDVFRGLETPVGEGDKLTFIPVHSRG
ncbi:MAG: hypothetical protein DRO52_03150 [Candidatus Hecatellales archaeon]|nr:MAG: hypothetical protein DRO52_03150 [Candidatus Hecatellales archaeon]